MWGCLLGLALPAWASQPPSMDEALARCPGARAFVAAHAPKKWVDADAGEVGDPSLRADLLAMAEQDQAVRNGDWSAAQTQRVADVDAANLVRLKRIVAAKGGLPDVAAVGRDGVAAAWLLVQHADTDNAMQAKVLDSLQPLLARGEVDEQAYVLLTDRVLVGQGKPQRYGSQLIVREGKWTPRAIAEPDTVDARRSERHQMPMADYLCLTSALMPPPQN